MVVRTWARALAAAVAAAALLAGACSAGNVLVVVGSEGDEATYSALTAILRDEHGHTVSVANARELDSLEKWGEYKFDHLALLADETTYTAADLTAFVNSGVRNILVASAGNAALKEFANECGLNYEAGAVVDHVSHVGDEHALVRTRAWTVGKTAALGPAAAGEVHYRGVSHTRSADSYLLQPVLDAQRTARLSDASGAPAPAGPRGALHLVSALQLRSNARVAFAGSLDLFADSNKAANLDFVRRLVAWTFQRAGVLRVAEFAHRKAGSASFDSPRSYRIKDDMQFQLRLEESDPATGQFRPYEADDVQLEVVMMDPYVRTTLKHAGSGRYAAEFRLPDVFGVYKFRVIYHRGSLSYIDHVDVVNLHPFRHDDYPRFLYAAYPYYISSFSLMGGFFLFGLVFLYSK